MTFESRGANAFIANAPGCHESTSAGDPQRPSPISAVSRAISVEICSGDGSGRVSSENWSTRAGVGSTATTTRSIAAAGGCDSRSSSASVRRVRASRIGAGNCSERSCTARVTRCSRTCSTAAPRPRRSRWAESGSISRPSTNDSGSSPSIGHSRSSACSKRSSGTAGRSGRGSSPRARRCHRTPSCPSRAARASAGKAATSPKVRSPHRRNVASTTSCEGARVRRCEGDTGSAFATTFSRSIGSGASAVASVSGSMTVKGPPAAQASSRAAVRVPAMATRTRSPRSAAVRSSSWPIARASPNSRVRPLRSIVTVRGPFSSIRGENSRATSISASVELPSAA